MECSGAFNLEFYTDDSDAVQAFCAQLVHCRADSKKADDTSSAAGGRATRSFQGANMPYLGGFLQLDLSLQLGRSLQLGLSLQRGCLLLFGCSLPLSPA